MNDAADTGITVGEMPAEDQSIPTDPMTTAAFVGRALCGPVDHPVLVRSFSEFARCFGGHWRHSSLAPAVEQFFAHGGRRAVIVRVANGATGASLTLPAGTDSLTLVALNPGSGETLRASVDYDAIDDPQERRFNLTLQRMSPQSRLVDDQEIYRRVCVVPDHEDNVADRLLSSRLARVAGALPTRRPDATRSPGADRSVAYVIASTPGSDGDALTDYDLIGSAKAYKGLFALQAIDQIDLLYATPPGNGHELGPAFLLVAERFCRRRGAMLIMDPPSAWSAAQDLGLQLRKEAFRSASVITYFPRMIDRRRPDGGAVAVGGALAGLLARSDERSHVWLPAEQGSAFIRDLVPAIELNDGDATLLQCHGVNALRRGSDRRARAIGDVTFSGGAYGGARRLSSERLVHFVLHRIERSTRWVLFRRSERRLWQIVERQVADFLEALASAGAFQSRPGDAGWFVRCNSSTNAAAQQGRPSVGLILGIRPAGESELRVFSLLQEAEGSRINPAAFAGVSAAAG